MQNLSLVKGQQAILTIIRNIQTSGKLLDQDIQLAGLSVINHAEEHGDITLACTLYLSMPKGSRKAALSAWLMTYGKLMPNTGLTKKEMPFLFDRSKVTDLESANNNPWYTFKLDKAPDQVFNVMDSIANLIKRIESAAAKGVPVEGYEKLDALRKLVPQV